MKSFQARTEEVRPEGPKCEARRAEFARPEVPKAGVGFLRRGQPAEIEFDAF